MVDVNAAAEEFETPEPEVKPEPERPAGGEETAAIKAQLDEALGELKELRGSKELVDRLKTAFSGGETPANPRDEYVRKEILRLMPELTDLSQLKKILPAVLMAMDATVEERIEEKAESARVQVKSLMKEAGLDPDDVEAAGYLEEAVTRAIKADQQLLAAWARGNTKVAVQKAFEKVSSKLLAPKRVGAKRDAVITITQSPKATPKGGAASAGSTPEKPKLDFSDTSREGTRKVHDAAFDYLQELINKE